MNETTWNQTIQSQVRDTCHKCGQNITRANQSSFIELDMEGEHHVCLSCSKTHCHDLLVMDY
jgi:hypothetical protein